MIILWIFLYMLPTIMGLILKIEDLWPIAFINVLLGWTIIGWLLALVSVFNEDAF